ncbi:hypothetical protein BD560DRAFT_103036 [Blakeslea trispora]|nr:hypothetical protein BD560DRAFT_103036 [Blakeslea trispora]
MDQSRSSSVPLLTLGDDFGELLKSSYSLPSIQAPSFQLVSGILSNKESEERKDFEASSRRHSLDNDSMLSSSSETEVGIAIHGRKAQQSLRPFAMSTLSSDLLYEDIWTDSPAFHDYLQQLRSFLQRYVIWLEKVEQCRQLEMAYNKSITLLFEQSKLILNEPFYTSTECQQLQWPTDIASLDDQDDMMNSVLSCLRDHSIKIKEVLARFENTVADLRTQHLQSLNTYCASQKQKTSQTNHRLLDDMSTSLFTSKQDLCKVLLEYIQTLNELIKSTRHLLDENICPLLRNHQLVKQANSNVLKTLVMTLSDFNHHRNMEFSSSFDISFSRFSFEDCHELNNDRLSCYIQEKLNSYYDYLTKPLPSNENITKSRSSSPGSLIPFLNLQRVTKYNSLDSVVSSTSRAFNSQNSQVTTRGYLFAKQKYPGNASIYPNGNSKNNMHANGNKWERYYFFIAKEDGCLKQYIDASVVQVVDLKKVDVQVSEADSKRDFVMQILSENNHCIISLQAETAIEFNQWIHALRSWNQNQSATDKSASIKKSSPKEIKPRSISKSSVSLFSTRNLSFFL